MWHDGQIMESVARKLEAEITEEVGTVVSVRGPHYEVRSTSGTFTARRAASCLVEPTLGDSVLLAAVDGGSCYVLCVLDGHGGATRIAFDGDTELRVRAGALAIGARDGVHIATPGDVSIVGGRFSLAAVDGNVVFRSLAYLGRVARCELDKVKSVVGSLEVIAERSMQKVQRSYRIVDEVDQLRAGDIDHAAEETMTLRARNTVITAEQLLKIDAEQIHIG